MDGHVAMAIPGALDGHRHIVPENLLVAETADRVGSDELALDIIEHRVWGERRYPCLDIMGGTGGDMVSDDLGPVWQHELNWSVH